MLKKKKTFQQIKRTSAIKGDLVKIYRDKGGKMPDISRLEHKPRSRLKSFLIFSIIILVLLSAISWLGFLIFSSPGKYKGQSIQIEIDGPKDIASGEEITYIVKYANREKVALKDLELFVRYPEGFTFLESEPASSNEFNNLWQMGDLAKDGQGEVKIKGKLIGEVGSIQNIDVTIAFEPENFGSTFKEGTTFSSQVTSSILELETEGPEKSLVEKKVTYTIKYRNTSDKDLENIQIIAHYPLNFIYQSADPKPTQDEESEREINNIWSFERLESKEEGEIKIEGGYIADDQQEKNFVTQIGFLTEEGDFQLQQEKSFITQMISQNLSLDLIINGSTTDQPVNFGDTLTYSVVYKNLGSSELHDIELTAILESDILDWQTLSDENSGQLDEEAGTIIWTKEEIENLEKLGALEEGTFDFSIKLKDFSEIDSGEDGLETKSQIIAVIGKIDDLEAKSEVKSNLITNSINTELQLKVEGRYFDEDNIAVGSGPLPPVVGQTTTFRIYWAIANSLHDVSEVIVTTSLPAGVEFADKFLVSVGKLNYSSKANSVIWEISQIPPNKTYDEVNVWFDVSVTPTAEQKGKLLILTTQTTLEATDDVTESKISKVSPGITSNLEHDPIGGGKGLVIDITE